MDELDRIDRQIDIDASAERVWELVSRPGWYINLGDVVSNPVLQADGDVTRLRHPAYGDFRLQTVTLDEPRYAAFRWFGENEQSTLVEFWIKDRDHAGVTLVVAESGFESLDDPDWLRKREENVEGWAKELAAAAAYVRRDEVHRAVEVAATPEQVWPLLTTPEGLAQWYAFDGAELDLRPDGALAFSWTEHGRYRGRVTEVDEPSTFAFRLAVRPDDDPVHGAAGLVTLTVAEAGPGSVVAVRHTAFDRLDPALGAATALAADERPGWENGLRRLAEVAARTGVRV